MKLGFLVQHFATILYGFSVCFKMELNLLPDLLKTRFKINEIGLFYGGCKKPVVLKIRRNMIENFKYLVLSPFL